MKELTPEEKIVYDVIKNSNGRITQQQIAEIAFNLGSHEIHEAHLKINHRESTLRKVRAIIRSLRINHHLFILSDIKGYWIMKDISEAKIFLEKKEKESKAYSRALFVTYNSMKRNFGLTSSYFENLQPSLFD